MKYTKPMLFLLLMAALPSSLNATESTNVSQSLGQSYLSSWFSVDSAESINMLLTPLEGVSANDHVTLHFTSDDGQTVNGILAYPTINSAVNKLALAMHPLGMDQQFWWSKKSRLPGYELTAKLRKQGYTVITLDARRHGQRSNVNLGPRELIKRAHSNQPRLYNETIIGSVRDYRSVLNWAKGEFSPEHILVMGYSMGAQMSLLLTSYEPSVDAVLAMVPPYVEPHVSPVAPRVHAQRITKATVLWFAGNKDPYSDKQQTQETFNKIASSNKELIWFDAGHILPNEFVATAVAFFDSLTVGGEK